MKANIRADGALIVTAENGIESFALQAWSKDYFKHVSTANFNNDQRITNLPETSFLIELYREE